MRLFVIFVAMLLVAAAACYGDVPPAEYRIGPEDVINVNVARHTEFSGDFFIPPDGVVDFPAVGPLAVTGKTLRELSEMVADKLGDRLREPEVTVTLKTARMQRVYILGVVKNSGNYDVKPGWRITEALAAAGGLVEGAEAADCRATVLRAASGDRKTVKLTDVMGGVAEANESIVAGDVLSIETPETMPIYVVGKVKNPGLFRLQTGSAGVVEALALAGGALEDAAISRVTVTHVDGASEVVNLAEAMVEGKPGPKTALRPGDLVTVPEETLRVAVLGYVNDPGFYPLKDGQKLLLTDALGLAKGVDNKNGKMSEIAVVRTRAGKQERMVYDVTKFLKSGDAAQNPSLQPGDVIYVPKSGKIDWDTVLRSITGIGFLLVQ